MHKQELCHLENYQDVVDLVESDFFYDNLQELANLIEPFAKASIDLEHTYANPATVFVWWRKFKSHVDQYVHNFPLLQEFFDI